jgi:hypothetical protein
LGTLGLMIDYFYNLSPRQFTNTLNGFRKNQDTLSQERWMMTAKIMWATAMPHCKSESGGPLKERDLIELPWQTNKIKEITEQENVLHLEEIKKVEDFYKLRDEKKPSI